MCRFAYALLPRDLEVLKLQAWSVLILLTARIKPYLLRRKKVQVATELPLKTEIVHWVDLSDGQRDVYETVRVAEEQSRRRYRRFRRARLDSPTHSRGMSPDSQPSRDRKSVV